MMKISQIQPKLINRFPRELARPFKDGIAYDYEDIKNFVRKYAQSSGVHISTYPFSTIESGKVDYESAVVDKIFSDIDGVNWLEHTRRKFKWCDKYDILTRFNMSGGGSHFFIFCKENIQFKRNCIFNFQTYLEKELKIQIDPQVKGDLSHTFRIPNTFNYKRGRYCIQMDEDLLFGYSIDDIYEIATELPLYKPEQVWYGNYLADLSDFDTEDRMYSLDFKVSDIDDLLTNNELDELNIPFDKFPPCIRTWLKNKELNNKGRQCLIIYLRDQLVTDTPIPYMVVVSILKRILSRERWLHCSSDFQFPGHSPGEKMRSIKKSYSNLRYKMYSCYQLRSFNLCPQRCGRWHPIYE